MYCFLHLELNVVFFGLHVNNEQLISLQSLRLSGQLILSFLCDMPTDKCPVLDLLIHTSGESYFRHDLRLSNITKISAILIEGHRK